MQNSVKLLIPPRHRLFAVFDHPHEGRRCLQRVSEEFSFKEDDIWVFQGEAGMRCINPQLRKISLWSRAVMTLQRGYTNDREYEESLCAALFDGAMVLAIKISDRRAPQLARWLRSQGARLFGYSTHWNYIPVGAAARSGP
jgi:hypothetical protein